MLRPREVARTPRGFLNTTPDQYRFPAERLIQQFVDWEIRARGITCYDRPVHPEPPFEPFWSHDAGVLYAANADPPPPLLDQFFDGLSNLFSKPEAPPIIPPSPKPSPEPTYLPEEQIDPVELQIIVPENSDKHAWADSIWRSVTVDGKQPFIDDELVRHARRKIERPLYGVVIRTVGLSRHEGRAADINRGMLAALGILSDPSSNELVCYPAPKYELVQFFYDVVYRRARRSGMLLNSDELISLAHLPSRAVQSPKLTRQSVKTKRAPKVVMNAKGLVLGDTWIAVAVLSTKPSFRNLTPRRATGPSMAAPAWARASSWRTPPPSSVPAMSSTAPSVWSESKRPPTLSKRSASILTLSAGRSL
jgi:hypothetical protein